MLSEQMVAILESLLERQSQATTADGYRSLLREAGFTRVAQFFGVLGGVFGGWAAR